MNPIENLKDLIVYQSQNNENISVEVLYDNEDFWLTQKSMSKLFEVEVNTINYHLKEIFETHELEENRTIRKIRTVQKEGNREVSREILFYSLDVIIAVGYRVNSKQATDFRIWATNTLKEYIKKGFVLNDELLKNGPKFGKNYFKELLERTVLGYFDYIEDLVERENTFTMEEFAKSINELVEKINEKNNSIFSDFCNYNYGSFLGNKFLC